MSKKLRLSHSQISTYNTCPFKYYLQRVKRLRPNYTKSSFLFGSAIDATVEEMLKRLGEEFNYQEVFLEAFNLDTVKVNNKTYKGDEALLRVQFSGRDIQEELIEEVYPDFLKECKAKAKKNKALNREEQLKYNDLAYACLIQKGLLIIEELYKWINENVVEVHEIQKKVEIENDLGDSFVGYLDFVVTLTDGRKVLIDLKTSSDIKKYYPEGCVEESDQLAIYAQEVEVEDAAYLAVDKTIRKKEPRVRLAFVEGKITEEQLDETFDYIAEATMEIKEGNFEKNENGCYAFGKCEYYNFCHYGSKKGLEQL